MKKSIVIIFFASILLLCACQPTPENSIVIGKDQTGMLEQAKETIAPEMQTLSLKERLEVPNRLTYAYQKGDLTVDADARIYVPDGELPIVRVYPSDFDQQTVTNLWNVLIGDRVMYETDTTTRSDIEKMMDYYSRVVSGELTQDQVEITPEEAQEMLDALKQQYLSAPEDGSRPIADGTLKTEYRDSVSQKNAAKRTVLHAYNYDERISFSVNNNFDNADFVITTVHYDENGNPTGSGGITVRRDAQIQYRAEADKAINCNTDVKQLRIEDPTPSVASASLQMTPAEAAQMTEEFLKDAKLSDHFAVQHIWLMTDDGEKNYCYRVECTRILNGSPCLWSENVWGDAADFSLPEWCYEKMMLFISDNGINRFSWTAPLSIGDAETSQTSLMAFSKVQAIMEKMLPILFEDEAHDYYGSEVTYTFTKHIDCVELGLWRVRERDNLDQGLLVPAWAFYGTTTEDTDAFDYHVEDYKLILLINAVDGTIIDATLGY